MPKHQTLSLPAEDSVPLDPPAEKAATRRLGPTSLGLLAVLWFLFTLVTSDFFTSGVVSRFGEKAVAGRNPTAWGVAIQGTFLVLFYALAAHLIDQRVL